MGTAANAQYIATPKTWQQALSAANTNRDGTGTIADLATGGASGSRIDSVRVQAIGTTTAGVIRLFSYDGTNTYCYREILVSAITPGTGAEAWSVDVAFPGGFVLPSSSWKLRASTHNAENFRIFAHGGDF